MGKLSQNMFSAASIGMNAYQSSQSASIQRMQAELAADNLEAQASRKELEAQKVQELGRQEQVEEVIKGRSDIAGKKTEYAASGVNVNSGSAVEVAADKAAWTEYRRQKIEYSADMQSWGLKYDAALLRQEAKNTVSGGSSGSGNAGIVFNTGKQLGSLFGKK